MNITPTIIKIGAGILAVLVFHLAALTKARLSISSYLGKGDHRPPRKPRMSDLFKKEEK